FGRHFVRSRLEPSNSSANFRSHVPGAGGGAGPEGVGAGAGAGATWALASLSAAELAATFVAVTRARRVAPTSPADARYEAAVAPAIAAQPFPPESQRCH